MSRFVMFWAFAAVCLLSLTPPAMGQWPSSSPYSPRPYSPYQPARSTMSPWFNLYNTNRGPLPNYYNYVVPRQQLDRTLQQQKQAIQRQDAEYRSLQGEVAKFERKADVRPTGAASTYFNHRQRFQNQQTFYRTR